MLCVTFCKSVSVCFRGIGCVHIQFVFKDTSSSIIFLVLQTIQMLSIHKSIQRPKLAAVRIRNLKKYLVHGQARQAYPNSGLYTKGLFSSTALAGEKSAAHQLIFSLLGKKISCVQQKNNKKCLTRHLRNYFRNKEPVNWDI